MSSWNRHHATSVYGECYAGDCSAGDSCCCWDGRGCPRNRVLNRFVTVGSIRYGLRVRAVSPPPPGVRYRVTELLQNHYHHHNEPPTATATEECCCNVVNLPWPRSVASVSRIPLLADKQQLSINSCGIFSSVNSMDMSSGSAGCSSLPHAERECERKRESNPYQTSTGTLPVAVSEPVSAPTPPSTPTPASTPSIPISASATVYRSRPSWSHPPQSEVRGCNASTSEHHLRASGGPGTTVTNTSATQLFFKSNLRRRVLARSRSDADASAYDTTSVIATVNTIANGSDPSAAIRGTLDRLHRFRFGGNRGNVRGKKNAADDKTDRLRELTDRLKSATYPSIPSSSGATSSQKKHALHQQQQHQPDNEHATSTAGPVPPPRTRQHHQSASSVRIQIPTATTTSTPSSLVVPAPNTPLPTSPTTATTNEEPCNTKLNLLKPESRPVIGSYVQRTVPFRSASFSQVDFSSSEGKYFRKRNTDSNDVHEPGTLSSETISSASLTLPRKRDNPTKDLSSCVSTQHLEKPTILECNTEKSTDEQVDKLFEIITQKASSIQNLSTTQRNDELTQSETGQQDKTSSDVRATNTKQFSATDTSRDSASSISNEEKKRDKSRRRKGMYISQWPDQRASVMLAYAHEEENPLAAEDVLSTLTSKPSDVSTRSSAAETSTSEDAARTVDSSTKLTLSTTSMEEKDSSQQKLQKNKLTTIGRADSLSEGENEHLDRRPLTPNREYPASPMLSPSDVSDNESRVSIGNDSLSPHTPRRYSKRPLRGPYGQMLEAEMKRPDTTKMFSKHNNELKFLEDLTNSPATHRSSNASIAASMISLNSGTSVSSPDQKPKFVARTRGASNHSLDDTQLRSNMNVTTAQSKPVFPINASSRKTSGYVSSSAPITIPGFGDIEPGQRRLFACHQRTTSSPSKLEEITLRSQNDRAASAEPSSDFLSDLLRSSTEQLTHPNPTESAAGPVPGSLIPDDTRTHIVVELYETERSYVESLQILVMKYLEPLKSAENSFLLDAALVDEIFYQVPALLSYHQEFLEELRKRLEHWDVKQKIGDVFLDFTKPSVVETYTAFINNWKRAKEVIKSTSQAKPAFARFLEAMAREHKGKLALDSLLIKPIQKFPKYELLIQRLIKHTDTSHPDYTLLLEAQKEIHENLIKINCTERETVEYEQQQQNLKELESIVEGLVNLVSADRTYLRHDLVTMTSGQGTRKERALFLFSDLLIITSIKRRSGTIRKPTGNCPGSVTSTLDANKYKLLMRIPLEDLEIMKVKDENVRRVMLEIENLTEDITVLNQISELIWSLHGPRAQLEDVVREMLSSLNRQLAEQQNSDSQLSYLDLSLNTPNGIEHLSVVFSQPEKRANWEESFNEAKHKLAMSVDRRPSPEFLMPVPIRKTRAGLQFTCAAPTLTSMSNVPRDVWVCNSDGYVGQVCVLSLYPEPTVTSCNGVCNARILCVASVPAGISYLAGSCIRKVTRKVGNKISEDEENRGANIQLDSSSSSADEEDSEREEYVEKRRRGSPLNRGKSAETASTDSSDDTDSQQPTMWLGTEDGCIHVYNCNDNIRIKKNKIRLQHGSSILCIIYLDNRVFVSLANGDITIYSRDQGGWNTSSPLCVNVSTSMMPVSKMLPNSGKLWCSCNNSIKIFNIHTLTVDHTLQTNGDQNKSITCMVISGLGVWLSLHNSAVIKCFHSLTYEFLCEVNMAPAVTKMLTSCDDIIRQHKAACLRVTSLLACKDLLWIGTSAGVLLTMPLPHITTSTTKITIIPSITGVPHGHTGHVRFLTSMESATATTDSAPQQYNYGGMSEMSNLNSKLLVISGGDGYEDFRSSNMSDVAGREDSTNHLLLWHV
ncbi:uncharacterized protein CBL_13229 [Carabus blaptoides fortunei]